MKIYLELVETFINADGLPETGQSMKIAANDRADALAKLPLYEPLFAGKTYVKQLHICNHDESGRETGCTTEEIA